MRQVTQVFKIVNKRLREHLQDSATSLGLAVFSNSRMIKTVIHGGNIGSNIAAINGRGIMYRPNNDRNKLTSYFMR